MRLRNTVAAIACILGCLPNVALAEVRSGTLVYNITINIKSKIDPPSGTASPQCGTRTFHWGSGAASYYEHGYVVATRSGSTATCKIRIPYLWSNALAASSVSSRIFVFLSGDDIPSKYTGPMLRRIDLGLLDIALPANGATTTFNTSVDF